MTTDTGNTNTRSTNTRVWFITGCSTGFGRLIATAALARGDRVVATARKPETLQPLLDAYPTTALTCRLDVTDQAQIAAGALKRRFASSHGMQPGDPDKAVAAILASLDAPELPLRLPLGSDALRMIRGKIAKVNEDLSAGEAVASTTDYDGRS